MVLLVKEKIVTLIVVLMVLSTAVSASAAVSVGVKKGDWIEYQVSFTGTPDPTHSVVAAKMEVLDVQGLIIQVNIVSTYSNGTQVSTNSTLNLETGQLIDNFIIPAGLTIGDKFLDSNVGNITITGSEQRTYAGATRTVINATSGDNTYVWDQATGISVEGISVGSDYTMNSLATATNIWQSETSGTDMTLVYVAVVIVAVFVIIAIAVVAARRGKK